MDNCLVRKSANTQKENGLIWQSVERTWSQWSDENGLFRWWAEILKGEKH